MMISKGIYAAVVTPADEDGNIQTVPFVRHANWLLEQGCHGLGVFGTTSETNCFSVQERCTALETYADAGLDPSLMIVGVGACARADSIALTRHALKTGAKRVLLMPPFFYKNNSDDGLFRSIAEVIDGVGSNEVEIYLYHFPQVSGVPVTKPVIERLLAAYPGTVVGLKDSSGDWQHTNDLIRSFPGFAVYSGADNHLLDNLEAGGAGTISAAANINAKASRLVFDAFEAGQMAEASSGMAKVSDVRQALTSLPLIPALKAYLETRWPGEPWANLRPPLSRLDDDDRASIVASLRQAGLE